jgi:hypothetical protein
MPFEPTRPPRDADSLASPELEALAEQLRQDAQWLVSRYPAHKPRLPLKRRHRMRWVAAGAVAVLLLLAVDGWRMWRRPASPGSSHTSEKLAGTAVPPAKMPGNRSEAFLPGNMSTPPQTRRLSLGDLNGAEKEAVLDLLEERTPKPSLSL